MADQENQKKGKAPKEAPEKVVSITNIQCAADGCNSKNKRFGFCLEHYDHFKFGLLKKDGSKPTDYSEKFKHYLKLQAKRQAA